MSCTDHGMQRQRHGLAKNLAEGVGGVIVGAALMVLTRQWLKRRQRGTLATNRSDAATLLAAQAVSALDAATPNSPGG